MTVYSMKCDSFTFIKYVLIKHDKKEMKVQFMSREILIQRGTENHYELYIRLDNICVSYILFEDLRICTICFEM